MVFATALGGAALAFSGGPTYAAIFCTGNECWHADQGYKYPPEAHVMIHPDNWKWAENEHFRWREHPGCGFWEKVEWREF